MLMTATYAVYLAISVAMTIWVAQTLHKNGRAFLVDAFRGNERLADSVNHLLVVGFYLLNLGAVSLVLKAAIPPETIAQSIELLSVKIGCVLLMLGLVHFFNIYLFARFRNNGLAARWMPPVAPDGRIEQ